MKDYVLGAKQILNSVGGADNVSQLKHCQTRLRFLLKDAEKADMDALKVIEGVKGVVKGAQFQVVIGLDVANVFDEIQKLLVGADDKTSAGENNKKNNIGGTIMDYIVSVFQPLTGALAGAGMMKALLALCTMAGIMTNTDAVYLFFNYAADATMYFLPLAVAVTSATKLGCSKLLALAIAGAMVLPNMTNMISGGVSLFGIPVVNVNYASQVFPSILMTLLLAVVEKYAAKICHKVIKGFMVPLICMLIVVPATFLVLGPVGYWVGTAFANVLLALYGSIGWLAIALFSAVLPFMIATGMHKPLLPYLINTMSTVGYECMYMGATLAHNIAESGACFAVAIRTKNVDLRATAISGGISALFGITEPAVYGVTLQNKRVLACISASACIAGAFMGAMVVKCFTIATPSLASMVSFVDTGNSMNIVWAFGGFGISLIVSFVTTLIFYRESDAVKSEKEVQS